MDAVSGIYGGSLGALPPAPAPGQSAGASIVGGGQTAPAGSAGNITLASLSSTSISASMESFISTYGPAMSNNDLLGAVLLLLTLEYLKSDDPEEKKGLLAALTVLAQQAGQSSAGGGSFLYSASSMSIETTQMQVISVASGAGAYSPGGDAYGPMPGGGMNIIA